MKKWAFILSLVMLCAACGSTPPLPISGTLEVRASASPTLTLRPTQTPRPPSPTPSPTPLGFDNIRSLRDYFGVPPVLDPSVQNDFPTDITTFASVHLGEDEPFPGIPSISVVMAMKAGVMIDLKDSNYGNPPMPAMDYIDKVVSFNPFYQFHPYEDISTMNPADCFFEMELLHRDMVFHVYDGTDSIGTGHIAKTPEFITYDHEVFMTAEFAMDDPVIKLEKNRNYAAISAEWHPLPRAPLWDEYSFTLDVDGKGRMVRGAFLWGQDEALNEEYHNAYYPPNVDYWYFVITYRGITYPYFLGDGMSNPEVTIDRLREQVDFADVNGDGNIELLFRQDWSGGWDRSTISFHGEEPAIILSQWGRY